MTDEKKRYEITISVKDQEDKSREDEGVILDRNMTLIAETFLEIVADDNDWAIEALSAMAARGLSESVLRMLFQLFESYGRIDASELLEDTMFLIEDDEVFYDVLIWNFIEGIIRCDERYLYLEDEAYGEM